MEHDEEDESEIGCILPQMDVGASDVVPSRMYIFGICGAMACRCMVKSATMWVNDYGMQMGNYVSVRWRPARLISHVCQFSEDACETKALIENHLFFTIGDSFFPSLASMLG